MHRDALDSEGQGDVVPGLGRLSWEGSHATHIGIGIMLYIYIYICYIENKSDMEKIKYILIKRISWNTRIWYS